MFSAETSVIVTDKIALNLSYVNQVQVSDTETVGIPNTNKALVNSSSTYLSSFVKFYYRCRKLKQMLQSDWLSSSYTISHYYSTNCNTIQIWSWCSRYLPSVGNRYLAIYVASYVLNVTTVPFEIKFTRPFLLQGFRLFCYQFVE